MRLCRRAHTSWHSSEEHELRQWFLAPCMKKYTRANPLALNTPRAVYEEIHARDNPLALNTPLSLTVCSSDTLCPKYLSYIIEDTAADDVEMKIKISCCTAKA
ncbi:hypothetical protein NDU88_005823 [Pleurodeles waltl]|uniref:Uncharacterized protein n=1 Tax=Pleurodeles waltl TaxID=8319 RepID=A0AAV7MNP8_PLEWA|nr:hypothetical protein NDU88_002641 [Pleurodeles waltl]KAJ1106600.1 hypothetical protein NDU88_004001 [Pleurodeles waltl]KAJ1210459.1 hypothetical protein NDU88_005823 [Pleurodeles waltl]